MTTQPAVETAPPPLSRRTAFIEDARRFAQTHKAAAPFRFLKTFTGAAEDELVQLMGKIYCDALPVTYGRRETLPLSCLKSLAQPFYFAASKRWFWRKESPVAFDVETTDPAYFERWYRKAYDALPGSKRITLWADALGDVALGKLVLLFLAPFFVPSLALLSKTYGMNFVASYRKALGLFICNHGRFTRRPCAKTLAYADDNVHPAQRLALRQACAGKLFVVQSGERTHHPAYAFGAMDVYLCYGPFIERLARDLMIDAGRVVPVGALYLNRPGNVELAALAPAPRFDVLMLDQLVWPYNEFEERLGRSLETIFSLLDRLKREQPALKIAYQLRYYLPGDPRKEAVLASLKKRFTAPFDLLENDGKGDSYANAAAARLVLTVNSTMGYEAFFLRPGGKTLFVNLADDPFEVYSDDPRFQLYDPTASYEAFAAAVRRLLDLKLEAPPECARERHAYFDGKVQERIARALASY